MRIVGQIFLHITKPKRTISLDEVSRLIRADGWVLERRSSNLDEEWGSFACSATPLTLAVCINTEIPDVLQLGFVEKWWRCTLGGGWAKPGFLPDDLIERISSRLRGAGWTVDEAVV